MSLRRYIASRSLPLSICMLFTLLISIWCSLISGSYLLLLIITLSYFVTRCVFHAWGRANSPTLLNFYENTSVKLHCTLFHIKLFVTLHKKIHEVCLFKDLSWVFHLNNLFVVLIVQYYLIDPVRSLLPGSKLSMLRCDCIPLPWKCWHSVANVTSRNDVLAPMWTRSGLWCSVERKAITWPTPFKP